MSAPPPRLHLIKRLAPALAAPLLALASLAWATPALAEPAAAPPGLPAGAVTQAFLGLVLVLALIGVAAFVVRRLPANRSFAQGAMKVVGGLAVGPRERVVLLEVGDTWVIIGIAPGQMRTLHTLPKGETGSANGPDTPAFSQWLRHFVDQRKKNDPA